MRPPARRQSRPGVAKRKLEAQEPTVLDLLDGVLDKGAMLAGVDLIYLRLSALLCAADRLLKRQP